MVTAVVAAGFEWPWRGRRGQLGPRLFVFAAGMALGALVAAATHNSMSDAWPAFIMGVGAPATIRGALAGVSVSERAPAGAAEPTAALPPTPEMAPGGPRVVEEGADGGGR